MKLHTFMVLLILLLSGTLCVKNTSSVESKDSQAICSALDEIMEGFRNQIGCPAASLAVSVNGNLVYEKGYGTEDEKREVPTSPGALFDIASCVKPMIAAAIKKEMAHGRLSGQTAAFMFLEIEPACGRLGDDRLKSVTIKHLLEHKGGWTSDPYRHVAPRSTFDYSQHFRQAVAQVLGHPLDIGPGHQFAYCNFGYDTLILVLEKVEKRTFEEVLVTLLNDGPFTDDVRKPTTQIVHTVHRSSPRVAWSAHKAGDYGPICASARALCTFMAHWWLDGTPWKPGDGHQNWWFNGSLPASTAVIRQLPGERGEPVVHYAALFNGRSAEVTHEMIENRLSKLAGSRRTTLAELQSVARLRK